MCGSGLRGARGCHPEAAVVAPGMLTPLVMLVLRKYGARCEGARTSDSGADHLRLLHIIFVSHGLCVCNLTTCLQPMFPGAGTRFAFEKISVFYHQPRLQRRRHPRIHVTCVSLTWRSSSSTTTPASLASSSLTYTIHLHAQEGKCEIPSCLR